MNKILLKLCVFIITDTKTPFPKIRIHTHTVSLAGISLNPRALKTEEEDLCELQAK